MSIRNADLIFFGGKIVSMNRVNSIVESVAVKDGKITAVGKKEEVIRWCGAQTKLVDLDGKTMFPGFIDPHSHVFLTAAKLASANLNPPPMGPVGEIADIDRVLAKYSNNLNLKPDDWIIGMGYDDTAIKEKRHPNREDLDKISSKNPIFLLHISGHLATVNSRALEIAKITKNTPDPEGGVIQRIPDSQEPNGVLEELAMYKMLMVLPKPSKEKSAQMINDALEYYASCGITTAQEAAAKSLDVLKVFQALAMEDQIPIDLVVYPLFKIAKSVLADFNHQRVYRGRYRIAGLKLVLDGSIQGYTAYLSQPYYVQPGMTHPLDEHCDSQMEEQLMIKSDIIENGHPVPKTDYDSYRGYPFFKAQESVTEWVLKSYKNKWPIIAHCNGDAAIDMLINAVSEAVKSYPSKDQRTTIIHAQTIREDQLDKVKELNMIPSFFPSHVYYWGDRHRDIFLGPERAKRIDPSKSALDRDILFTLHHDSPIVAADMLHLIWSAVNRVTSNDKQLGPEQRIPVIEAIRAVTINAAYQIFEENVKGSIETGKLADFVILSDNPVEVDPMMIKDIMVLETIKEGKTVYLRKHE